MAADEASKADYVLWLKRAAWSDAEAAALLAGAAPGRRTFLQQSPQTDTLSQLIDFAKASSELEHGELTPHEWIQWALKTGLELPSALGAVIKSTENKKHDQLELGTREHNILLKIICTLADLNSMDLSKASKSALQISTHSEKLGIPVSERTVDKHLKKARQLLESNK